MTMELRAWVWVAEDIAPDDEDRWLPFIKALERHHADLGPVLGWDERGLHVVVSADVADEADLALVATEAVIDALHRAGLHHDYPTAIEIEPADDEAAVAA